MRKPIRFLRWLFIMRNEGDTLLSLLIAAHNIHQDRTDFSMAFRAGVKIGRKYPDISDKLLNQETEWHI